MVGTRSFPFGSLLLLVGGQGASALFGFANVALAAHGLSAAEFGFLAIGLALAQGLHLAGGTQSWQAVMRHGGRRPLRLAISLAHLDGALAVIAALLYLAIIHLAGAGLGLTRDAGACLSWLALGVAMQVSDPWQGVLMARGRNGLVAMIQGGAALLRFLGVAAVLHLGGGLGGLVAVHLVADALLPLFMLVAAVASQRSGLRILLAGLRRPLGPARLRARFPGLGRLLAVGSGISLLASLGSQVDVPLAAALLGPAEAGRYRLLRGLVGFALVIATPLRQVSLGHWAGAGNRDLRPALLCAGLTAAVAAAAGWLGFAVVADRLLPVLFGMHGVGLAGPACIILLAAATTILATLPQAILVARRHEPWNLAGQAVAVAVHLALLPILALAGGLGLAAWSLPCAQTALLAVVGAAAWRHAGAAHA